MTDATARRSAGGAARPGWVTGAVAGLLVMIVWTLVIKYLAPLTWAWAERLAGREAAPPLQWDFWPLAHAALAALLWRGHPRARLVGIAIAAVEIAVVTTKLALWLRAPDLGFWKLLWFGNKLYVLIYFACLLYVLMGPARAGEWPGSVPEAER